MKPEDVVQVIQELENRYIEYRDQCSAEDSRTYYSNQTAIIALEELKLKIKKMT